MHCPVGESPKDQAEEAAECCADDRPFVNGTPIAVVSRKKKSYKKSPILGITLLKSASVNKDGMSRRGEPLTWQG